MCKNKQKYDKIRQFSLPFSSIETKIAFRNVAILLPN